MVDTKNSMMSKLKDQKNQESGVLSLCNFTRESQNSTKEGRTNLAWRSKYTICRGYSHLVVRMFPRTMDFQSPQTVGKILSLQSPSANIPIRKTTL